MEGKSSRTSGLLELTGYCIHSFIPPIDEHCISSCAFLDAKGKCRGGGRHFCLHGAYRKLCGGDTKIIPLIVPQCNLLQVLWGKGRGWQRACTRASAGRRPGLTEHEWSWVRRGGKSLLGRGGKRLLRSPVCCYRRAERGHVREEMLWDGLEMSKYRGRNVRVVPGIGHFTVPDGVQSFTQPIFQLYILLVDVSQHLLQYLAHGRVSLHVFWTNDSILPMWGIIFLSLQLGNWDRHGVNPFTRGPHLLVALVSVLESVWLLTGSFSTPLPSPQEASTGERTCNEYLWAPPYS